MTIHKKILDIFEWCILVGIAIVLALLLDSKFDFFWKVKSYIRLIFLLFTFLVVITFLHIWLIFIKQKIKRLNLLNLLFTIIVFIINSVWFTLLKGNIMLSMIPSAAFRGNGDVLGKVVDLLYLFFIQPCIFILSIFSAKFFIRDFVLNKFNIPFLNMKELYNRLFISLFMFELLLPNYGVTNFLNIDKEFFGRNWLIHSYSGLCVFLQNRVFDSSIIGRDNWLIFTGGGSIDDYQNTIPLSDYDLSLIHGKLNRLSERLTKNGVKKIIIIIPPNKESIYPEYFPNEIQKIGSESRLDQLINYPNKNSKVKILDLRPTLLANKVQYPLYYKTDTHWNMFGALLAYQEIIREVQKAYPNMNLLSLEDFKIVPQKFLGSTSKALIKFEIFEETIKLEPLFSKNIIKQKWKTDETIGTGYNLTMTNPDSTLPRLLMFRDSFSTDLESLIAENFSRSVLIWSLPTNESYYDSEKPDVVIIEMVERNLKQLIAIPN